MRIDINGEITQEVANYVRAELARSKEPVEVHIDSQGGDVFAGLSIYNMLQHRDVKIYVDGLAGSIASVIALSGDKRPQISETGTFAIHNALIQHTEGNHHDLRQVANGLQKFSEIVASVYEKKTNLNKDEIKELMDSESVFTAEESVKLGFADSIFEPLKAVAYIKNIDMGLLDKIIKNNMATTDASVTEAIDPSVQADVSEEVKAAFDEAQVAEITAICEKVMSQYMEGTEAAVTEQVGQVTAEILDKVVSEGSVPQKNRITQPTNMQPVDGYDAFFKWKNKIKSQKIS